MEDRILNQVTCAVCGGPAFTSSKKTKGLRHSNRDVCAQYLQEKEWPHQSGTAVMVFDSQSWLKTRDIGDNSIYWKKAQVIRCRMKRSLTSLLNQGLVWLIDVRFEDGRESNGHYTSSVKEC